MSKYKENFKTKTTVFNSLDQMCKAIPKIDKSIGGYGEPVLTMGDSLKISSNLIIGEFIYLMPKNVKNLSDEEISVLISDFKGVNNYDFFNKIINRFKELNDITPAGLIENLNPGLIYWFKNISTGDELYYLDSILPRINKEYIDDFVCNNIFCSSHNLVKRFIQNICLQRRLNIE